MMRAMRASTKYIFFVLMIAFVAWLALDYSGVVGQRSGTVGDVVARVNGTEIKLETFYNALRFAQQQPGRPFRNSLEDQKQLEDQVFEELVQRALLQQEYRRRGITVTDREIVEAARVMPPQEVLELPDFQTDGQFDIEKYQRFVASGADPQFLMALEARYREELPQIKLYQQLVSGVYVSDAELWRVYQDRVDSTTIKLVHIRPDAVVADASIRLEDADVEAYYRAHSDEFEQPAEASLSYLSVSRELTTADSAQSLGRAQSILKELGEGGDFAAIALRESADSVSRAQGGDLGWLRRGQTVAPFDSTVFALRPGVISPIVTTQFGHHIIQVEETAEDSVRARHVLIPIELTPEHLEALESAADSLDELAAEQTTGEAGLEAAANAMQLAILPATVRKEQRLRLGGEVVPDASLWAFTAVRGETSPVIEAEHAYYVFRLDSLRPARVPPLSEVRMQVSRRVRLEKKLEASRAVARRVAEQVAAGTSLDAAAAAEGLTAEQIGPFSRAAPPFQLYGQPEAIGAAFGLRVGETSGAIESRGGILFVEPVSRRLAQRDEWEEQKQQQRQQVLQGVRQRRITEYLQAMRASAAVIDRRPEIDRIQRELADQEQRPFGVGF